MVDYVDNAGLVLAGPFLPHLFETLGYLMPDETGRRRMRDAETASRAVHLLQWLVDERADRPETVLLLNKILCGLPVDSVLTPSVPLNEQELAIGEQLLRAMLANWSSLRNSPVSALRETFLQREGRLERQEGGWSLRVQRKAFDVLVDQIPWGFSMVHHAWQPASLATTW